MFINFIILLKLIYIALTVASSTQSSKFLFSSFIFFFSFFYLLLTQPLTPKAPLRFLEFIREYWTLDLA